MLRRSFDRLLEQLGLRRRHDARRHVVGQAVEHLRRLADREAGRGRHRRHHALEALARLGQLGRDDRRFVGDLAAHVRGNQADDALGLRRTDTLAAVAAAGRDRLDPQLAVGVGHHLDHRRVGQSGGDDGTEGGAQHLPAASLGLLASGMGEEIRHGRRPPLFRPPGR
jgi:hypothetical protein